MRVVMVTGDTVDDSISPVGKNLRTHILALAFRDAGNDVVHICTDRPVKGPISGWKVLQMNRDGIRYVTTQRFDVFAPTLEFVLLSFSVLISILVLLILLPRERDTVIWSSTSQHECLVAAALSRALKAPLTSSNLTK